VPQPRILAVDYGRQRCGLAVTDASGTLARPLETVERAASPAGLATLAAIVEREQPDLIVIGMPRTPSGARGSQAQETAAFAGRLRALVNVPIEWEDERYTTTIAERSGPPSPATPIDSRAAAVLLQGVLDRRARP
jgi:putative holliday junction resolvase